MLRGDCSYPLIHVVWLWNFNMYPDSIMFMASTLRIMGWVLLTAVALGAGYMLLEKWLFEIDFCSLLICTEGYPCFEQGNCSHWKDPPDWHTPFWLRHWTCKITGSSLQILQFHNQTNWVGPFCRWVSKVKIYLKQYLELGSYKHWPTYKDRKHRMSEAEKPEFAKQSLKGFVMRIMMMIDMFKNKRDD